MSNLTNLTNLTILLSLLFFIWLLEFLILKYILNYLIGFNKSKKLLKDLERLNLENKISKTDYTEKRNVIIDNIESKKLFILAVFLFFIYIVPLIISSYLLFDYFIGTF